MSQLSILIVDDEVDLATALAERLELRGWKVEIALTGDKALQHLGGTDFEVVIIDVKMPGMSGLELMANIKRQRPGTKVILFTGLGSDADAERGMQEGASAYLIKPIDIQKLIEEINKVIRENGA